MNSSAHPACAAVIVDVPFMDAAAKPFLVDAVFNWLNLGDVRTTPEETAQLRERLDAEPSLWMLHVYGARARWARTVLDVLEPAGDSVALAGERFDGLVTRSAKDSTRWQYTWLRDGVPLGDSQHVDAADAVNTAWGDGLRPRKATGAHGLAATRAVIEHREDLDAWNARDDDRWDVDPPKLGAAFDLHLVLMQGPNSRKINPAG
jgi:hypothetical protein